MITGPLCHAARVLIELTRENLSQLSGVELPIIVDFEDKVQVPTEPQIAALREVLEAGGAVFIAENGGGVGVRLKFNEEVTESIENLENEGGRAAPDHLP